MAYDESMLSTKQRGMLRREQEILGAAERILIADGFLDMSMPRIAAESKCPRGTIYRHFASREDIVVALACSVWEERLAFMERGASYPGPTRVRMGAVGEGCALHFSLCPERFSLLYKATETVCENASPIRLERLRRVEWASSNVLRQLIEEAVRVGELPTKYDAREIVYAYSAQVTGGYVLQQSGVAQGPLEVSNPMEVLRNILNLIGDAYGWRPLSNEIDWEQTAAQIRRAVFPEETQRIFGPGVWHGKWGDPRPNRQASLPSWHVNKQPDLVE